MICCFLYCNLYIYIKTGIFLRGMYTPGRVSVTFSKGNNFCEAFKKNNLHNKNSVECPISSARAFWYNTYGAHKILLSKVTRTENQETKGVTILECDLAYWPTKYCRLFPRVLK